MFKIIVFTLLVLLSVSCAQVDTKQIKANQKVFEQEDLYILKALYAQESRDFRSAAAFFETLYLKSGKKEYFYALLESHLLAKEYENLLQKIDSFSPVFEEDFKVMRFKIITLYQLDRLTEAEKLSMVLAKKTDESDDFLLVSDVLVKSKQYELALYYLESAYIKEYNEEILDKIAIILYVNLKREEEAISRLVVHSRVHGLSKLVTSRLLGFYSNQNNIEGLLATYKRAYDLEKDEELAKKIIQILNYKRDHLNLTLFLEESSSDDALLLQLYNSAKNYKKAYLLAEKLYMQTEDINYLAQSAIFEYENAKIPKDKLLIKRVIAKLEKVIKSEKIPMYLNYLGYLLIDHDIDVKRGMLYIKEALKLEPESSYYLDSLAWGYYKLGECKKAQSIIKKVQTLPGGDHQEVLDHSKKIEQCIQNQKKGN